MFEETKEGLNLEIVDQDGRSMFADGSKVPYDRTRRLIQKLAVPLKATPLPASHRRPHRGRLRAGAQRLWRVRSVGRPRQRRAPDSRAGRAAAVHIFAVSGKADSQPLFPDDPYVAGQPSRDHHADARGSAAAARPEAVSRRNYHNTLTAWDIALRRSVRIAGGAMVDRLTGLAAQASIAGPDQINRQSVLQPS